MKGGTVAMFACLAAAGCGSAPDRVIERQDPATGATERVIIFGDDDFVRQQTAQVLAEGSGAGGPDNLRAECLGEMGSSVDEAMLNACVRQKSTAFGVSAHPGVRTAGQVQAIPRGHQPSIATPAACPPGFTGMYRGTLVC